MVLAQNCRGAMMTALYRVFRTLSFFILLMTLSGCAGLTHYNYQRNVLGNTGSAIYSDAKQRAVLTTRQPGKSLDMLRDLRNDALRRANEASLDAAAEKDADKKKAFQAQHDYHANFASNIANLVLSGKFARKDMRVIAMCAEPSPDALSALAASGGLAAEVFGQGKGQIQAALAESAGSIGLRTQSIQLMRDAMYRLCEGYMNGALGNAAFETLHRRFQNSMVAILAIEQLTGVVQAQAVALNSNAQTGALKELAAVTDQLDSTRAQHRKAETDAGASKKAADDKDKEIQAKNKEIADEKEKVKKDDACKALPEGERAEKCKSPFPLSKGDRDKLDEDIKTQQAAIDGAEKEKEALDKKAGDDAKRVTDLNANIEALERAADGLRLGQSTASAIATLGQRATQPALGDKSMKYVSYAVMNIVDSFYSESYIDEVCTTLFTAIADDNISRDALREVLEIFEYPIGEFRNSPWLRKRSLIGVCKAHIASELETARVELGNNVVELEERQGDLERQQRLAQLSVDTANAERRRALREVSQQQGVIRDLNSELARLRQLVASGERVAEKQNEATQRIAKATGSAIQDFEKTVELLSVSRQSACEQFRKSGFMGVFKNAEA
ncbi:MAG: hypothetical protein ACX939_08390, partial [Hyphococcus sp.]